MEKTRGSEDTERFHGRALRVAMIVLFLLLSAPGVFGEELGAILKGDLGYSGLTLWEDAKTIARAPLEIGKLSEVTPQQLLVTALVLGSVGGMIALDRTIRDRAKGIDDGSALTLEYAGFGLLSGGMAALYGTGLWTDDEQMRNLCVTGLYRINSSEAKKQLLAIYGNSKVTEKWRDLCARYLRLALEEGQQISRRDAETISGIEAN